MIQPRPHYSNLPSFGEPRSPRRAIPRAREVMPSTLGVGAEVGVFIESNEDARFAFFEISAIASAKGLSTILTSQSITIPGLCFPESPTWSTYPQ